MPRLPTARDVLFHHHARIDQAIIELRQCGLMSIQDLTQQVRGICSKYEDREARARRLYMEEQASTLANEREREFTIKSEISRYFSTPYSSICFCGSAQIGFSVISNSLFQPGVSDLDVACIDVDLFQKAWIDIVAVTRGFTDLTPFGSTSYDKIRLFKEQILKRGMILIDKMPQSTLSHSWLTFQDSLSRDHTALFGRISVAIYMNEYAFCWKQDSALAKIMKR